MKKWKIIDTDGLILGRLASKIAKMVLLGDNVVLINTNGIQISGNKNDIIDHYIQYKNVRTASNPKKGPFRVGFQPHTFIKKTIKPMLPKNERGKIAMKRIHSYIYDIPEDKKAKYGKPEEVKFGKKFQATRLGRKKISVGEVCKIIGWTKGGEF